MIVVDSSAIVAMLLDEQESSRFTQALAGSPRSCVSALNAYETALVHRRRSGASAVAPVWRLFALDQIEIVPFDEAQALAAASAYARYGKNIDANARLDLADCAASALAKTLNAALLFKGADFAATDIRSCF